jgi:hypothetical protein
MNFLLSIVCGAIGGAIVALCYIGVCKLFEPNE